MSDGSQNDASRSRNIRRGLSRRELLKYAGGAGLVLAGNALLAACGGGTTTETGTAPTTAAPAEPTTAAPAAEPTTAAPVDEATSAPGAEATVAPEATMSGAEEPTSAATEAAGGETSTLEGNLLIWTFFDQVEIAAAQFMKKHPNVKVDVEVFPGDQYETKMRLALQTGQDAPDIFDTDLGYQGKYINGPFMEDLSAMGAEEVLKDYVPYLVAFSKDENGSIRAIIDHSAPGGFWYRRDVAEEYLGTRDPAEVSARVDSWDKIIEIGKEVATKSNGQVHLLDSYNAVISVERYSMQPWVADGKLVIDDKWNAALDAMREIRANNVDAKLDAFSPAWGTAWNNGSVMMFAWPSWASFLVDAEKSGNNWGVAKAPKPYYGGGRFGSIWTGSQNKELAFEYLKFVASPDWQQFNLEETLNMPALQTVYKENMTSFQSPMFDGQPILETYYDIAMTIPEQRSDQYQEAIGNMFTSAVSDMIQANGTNESAFDALKEQVQAAYPEIQV